MLVSFLAWTPTPSLLLSQPDNRISRLLDSCEEPELAATILLELRDIQDPELLAQCVQHIREAKHNHRLIQSWQNMMGNGEVSTEEESESREPVVPSQRPRSAPTPPVVHSRPETAGRGFGVGLDSPDVRPRPATAPAQSSGQSPSTRQRTPTAGALTGGSSSSSSVNDKEGAGRPPSRRGGQLLAARFPGRDLIVSDDFTVPPGSRESERPGSTGSQSTASNRSPNIRDNYFVRNLAESVESPNKLPDDQMEDDSSDSGEYVDDGQEVHVGAPPQVSRFLKLSYMGRDRLDSPARNNTTMPRVWKIHPMIAAVLWIRAARRRATCRWRGTTKKM